MGPAAGGMHLLPRDHIARAHRVLLTLAIFAPALAHANATQGCMGKTAMVVGKLEIGSRFPGMIVRSQSEIFIDAIGIHDLTRIHLPVWIPNRLEFAKRFDQLRSKHLVKKLGFRLPIPMLSR